MIDIAASIARINETAPPFGRVTHVGDTSFGQALVIHRFILENGLTVLLARDDTAPIIAFHAWFRVGSRHEKPGKTGLAHLFEHLMFNEVEGLPAGQFDTLMEAAGADNNASTWLDFTQYQEAFPKQHLSLVLDLEARRMSDLVLRDAQVSSEKEVVKNERRYRVEDDVEGTVEELLWKTAFETHPYHWPTIGWMEDIESFTTEDCRAFYDAYYAPNNATLVLVGDLDVEVTLREISGKYGKLSASAVPTETPRIEPEQIQSRRVEITQPTSTQKVVIGYKGPAIADDDHNLLGLLVDVMTGGRASRLHRRLIRTEQIASDVSGFVGPHVDPSLIEFSIAARGAHECEQLLNVFDDEILRLLTDGVTEDEVHRARNRTELGLLGSLDTADGKASSIGFHETVLGDPAAAFTRLKRLEFASPTELREVARRWFREERRTVVLVRPSSVEETA